MLVKKYEIVKNEAERLGVKNVYEGCTLDERDQAPETLERFSDLEEARKALAKYGAEITPLRPHGGKLWFAVVEVYIAENVYNEKDEWQSGGDIWAFAPLSEFTRDSLARRGCTVRGQEGWRLDIADDNDENEE